MKIKTKLLTSITGAALAAALLLCAPAAAAERVFIEPGNSPSLGPPGAPVRIIEFVDYQ